jgi:hypothetical protein
LRRLQSWDTPKVPAEFALEERAGSALVASSSFVFALVKNVSPNQGLLKFQS